MKYFLVASLALSVLWCSDGLAHQDRIFPIDEHGNIEGIAEKFSPASIVVLPSGKQEPEVKLTLSGKTVHLPACLAKLFVMPAGQTLRADGSWWHDQSSEHSLPPYLVIAIPEKTHGPYGYDGYNLVFNLRTADLIEVRKQETDPDGSQNLDLGVLCTEAELRAIAVHPTSKMHEGLADKPQDLGEGLMTAAWCTLEGIAYWLLGALALVLLFWVYRRRSR